MAPVAIYAALIIGVLFLCWAAWLSCKSSRSAIGGEGGMAKVSGRHSSAEGGAGGDAHLGSGAEGGTQLWWAIVQQRKAVRGDAAPVMVSP